MPRERRASRRTAWALPGPVVWLCRAQALALVAGAGVIIVLSGTSTIATGTEYVAADAALAMGLAALLTGASSQAWARTPILLTEILAVLVATQVWSSGRPLVALAVGLPAAAAVVLIAVSAKPPRRNGRTSQSS